MSYCASKVPRGTLISFGNCLSKIKCFKNPTCKVIVHFRNLLRYLLAVSANNMTLKTLQHGHWEVKKFLHKTSYLSSTLTIRLKFFKNTKEDENTLAQNAKNTVCASVKISKIFLNFTLAQTAFLAFCAGVFVSFLHFAQKFMLIIWVEETLEKCGPKF